MQGATSGISTLCQGSRPRRCTEESEGAAEPGTRPHAETSETAPRVQFACASSVPAGATTAEQQARRRKEFIPRWVCAWRDDFRPKLPPRVNPAKPRPDAGSEVSDLKPDHEVMEPCGTRPPAPSSARP